MVYTFNPQLIVGGFSFYQDPDLIAKRQPIERFPSET